MHHSLGKFPGHLPWSSLLTKMKPCSPSQQQRLPLVDELQLNLHEGFGMRRKLGAYRLTAFQTHDHNHLAGLKSSVTSTDQVCLSSFPNQLLRNKQKPEAGNSPLAKDRGERFTHSMRKIHTSETTLKTKASTLVDQAQV